MYVFVWLSQVRCETLNSHWKCWLISGHHFHCSTSCIWLPSSSLAPCPGPWVCDSLCCSFIPHSPTSFILFANPLLVSKVHASCSLCGFCSKINKEDPLDTLTLVKDAEDNIPSLTTSTNTQRDPYTYIYIYIYILTYYLPAFTVTRKKEKKPCQYLEIIISRITA